MSSRRLPGKALVDLAGSPLVERVTVRASLSQATGPVHLVTSAEPSDDSLAAWSRRRGVATYRGPLENVAARVYAAAAEFRANAFVRISGDSPFIDPRIIDFAVDLFETQGTDIVTNVWPRTFPRGQSVEVISVPALARLIQRDLSDAQKEHVTAGFYRAPFGTFDIVNFGTLDQLGVPEGSADWSDLQLSVDSPSDLIRAERVAMTLAPLGADYTWLDAASAMTLEPPRDHGL